MLFGLSSSTKVTKLNIVINPFKKSHCPNSPLSVCKNVLFVAARALVVTNVAPKVREIVPTTKVCVPAEADLNWGVKVSPVFKISVKVPEVNKMAVVPVPEIGVTFIGGSTNPEALVNIHLNSPVQAPEPVTENT